MSALAESDTLVVYFSCTGTWLDGACHSGSISEDELSAWAEGSK